MSNPKRQGKFGKGEPRNDNSWRLISKLLHLELKGEVLYLAFDCHEWQIRALEARKSIISFEILDLIFDGTKAKTRRFLLKYSNDISQRTG